MHLIVCSKVLFVLESFSGFRSQCVGPLGTVSLRLYKYNCMTTIDLLTDMMPVLQVGNILLQTMVFRECIDDICKVWKVFILLIDLYTGVFLDKTLCHKL